VALNWIGPEGQLLEFEYSNRKAAYLGERLVSGGQVIDVDRALGEVRLELFIRNQDDDIITPGQATVRLGRAVQGVNPVS
jgi:3-methylfumaryl-CoA hydratase